MVLFCEKLISSSFHSVIEDICRTRMQLKDLLVFRETIENIADFEVSNC